MFFMFLSPTLTHFYQEISPTPQTPQQTGAGGVFSSKHIEGGCLLIPTDECFRAHQVHQVNWKPTSAGECSEGGGVGGKVQGSGEWKQQRASGS